MTVPLTTEALGDISAIAYGYTESASMDAIGPKFLRITDIQDDNVDWDGVPYCPMNPEDLRKHRLHDGDIVFARTGATTGKSFLVREPPEAVPASYLIRLRLTDARVAPEFLALFFQTKGYWRAIREGTSGSAQGGFNASKLAALELPFPPLEEQRRIVAVLDEAFAAIATAIANAEKNIANVEVWFETELSSCFVETSPQRPLGTIANLVRGPFGGSLKKDIFKPEGFAVYEQQHAIYDQFDSVRYYVDEKKFLEMKRFEVRTGELIMSCSGTIGRVALVPEEVHPGIINQALLKITPSESCLGEYLLWYMRSQVFRAKLAKHSGGAALQNVASVAVLKTIEVPLPDTVEQETCVRKIHRCVEVAEGLTSLYEQKVASLSTLRQSLLHRAFSGELTEREPLAA